MKIFPWRGRISRGEFRRRFIERMRVEAPHLAFAESAADDLDVSVTGAEHLKSCTISLHRGYREMEADPANCDEILDRWVKSQAFVVDPQPVIAENVLPFIKDLDWLARYRRNYDTPLEPMTDNDMLHDVINDELVVAYADFRAGIHFLHRSSLAELALSQDRLREVALENLRRRTPERTVKDVAGALLINVGGNFESAMIVDEQLWQLPALAAQPQPIFAVPERNWLLAARGVAPLDVWTLSRFSAALHRDEAYPISPRLMVRRDGRIELLDPLAIDDTHPIPNLDVIDVFAVKKGGGATLGVTLATPLDVSPRSIHRLFRKVDAYLDYITTEDFRKDCGEATIDNTEIELNFVAHPDVQIVEIYDDMNGYVASRGAQLQVQYGE